jgi:hypothetical protein
LKFTVTPSATNIARTELFSTGGSVGVVTNQTAAQFAVPAASLGLGLHPFYALVTDSSGHRYQTQTVYYRVLPAIQLTITGAPPSLSWTAIAGRQYDLQMATNLANGFQTVTTLNATNGLLHWSISTTGRTGYYRVQLDQ